MWMAGGGRVRKLRTRLPDRDNQETKTTPARAKSIEEYFQRHSRLGFRASHLDSELETSDPKTPGMSWLGASCVDCFSTQPATSRHPSNSKPARGTSE